MPGPTMQERFAQLARDGKLNTAWRKMKTEAARGVKGEAKRILGGLYTQFDSGFSKAIAKFEKCKSLADAKRYANEAIAIAADYRQKVTNMTHADPDIRGDLANAKAVLGRTCDQMLTYLRECVRRLDDAAFNAPV